MFEYEITNFQDETLYHEQCRALEKHIPGLTQSEQVTDVDGTLIRSYLLGDKKLVILNSKDFGIYIRSEFDIDPYFDNH